MGLYRKYLEPEYGEVAPEVEVMEPQAMDLEHTKVWRAKSNYESIAAMTAAFQKCNCYEKVMTVVTEDITLDAGEGAIRVRIYRPDDTASHAVSGGKQESGLPVLIFYHGGAFSMNSIEVYEYVHRYLAYYGNFVVVAPDYHLAPEYKFPKGLNEAYETLVWTGENIAEYGGDPADISVCGDSSGGNFAAVVSMLARDKKGPAIRRQILYYPLTTNYETEMTDSEKRYGKGYFLEYNCLEDPMALYFEKKGEEKNPLASPLLCDDLTGLPKACFISAECDPLLDQGLMYAAKLEDAQVEVEYHIMKGMVHGFINWTYGKTFEALDHAIRFIREM